MVDRLRDNEDLKLETLFRSEPIADAGFSAKVLSRVRRQNWIRRLSMPIAFLVGAVIAFKPVAELVKSLSGLLSVVPPDLVTKLDRLPVEQLPQLPVIWMGAMLVVAVMMASRLLQD